MLIVDDITEVISFCIPVPLPVPFLFIIYVLYYVYLLSKGFFFFKFFVELLCKICAFSGIHSF